MALVITNGNAGASEKETLERLARRHGHEPAWTSEKGDAKRLAREAAKRHVEMIIVAGGDGTINEVTCGLVDCDHIPKIAILPTGTGNDLSRSLGIPLDLEDAFALIEDARAVPIDVGRLVADGEERYFLNMSAVGFAGVLDRHLEAEDKSTWGTFAYVKSGLKALSDISPMRVEILADGQWFCLSALNVVAANGRFAGGGVPVAPKAWLDDGFLDFVAYLGEGPQEQLLNLPAILRGVQLAAENVLWWRGTHLELRLDPPSLANYDGEALETQKTRLVYDILPAKLNVLAGTAPALCGNRPLATARAL